MAKLLINKNSWHYRYWSFIRNFWGASNLPDQTSLCPYCQTMIWLSVLTFVTSPLLFTGWLVKKLYRVAYKSFVQKGFYKLVDFLDNNPLFKTIDEVIDGAESSPAGNVLTIFMGVAIVLMGTIAAVIVLCLLPFAVYYGVIYAVWGAWTGITYAGWAIVWGFAVAGAMMLYAAEKVAWFFTTAWIWETALHWVVRIVTLVVVSVAAVFLCYGAWISPLGQRLWDWIGFKLNGYKEAKAKAYERRIEEEKKAPPKPSQPSWWDRKVVPVLKPLLLAAGHGLQSVGETIHDFFVSTKVEWKGSSAKVLSPMATLWQFLVAVKHGVCPLVEFVEGGELENELDMRHKKHRDHEHKHGGRDEHEHEHEHEHEPPVVVHPGEPKGDGEYGAEAPHEGEHGREGERPHEGHGG